MLQVRHLAHEALFILLAFVLGKVDPSLKQYLFLGRYYWFLQLSWLPKFQGKTRERQKSVFTIQIEYGSHLLI